jgi:hypothetical protein
MHTRTPGSETELIAARESVSRVELELELHRWLPAVKQVLVEDLVDPASYTIQDAGTLLELKGDKLAKLYLTKFKLFGTDINSELRELFLAKLADTQLPGTTTHAHTHMRHDQRHDTHTCKRTH